MTNKQSSILNNDFYIFILILLLIIMLFMLSPKDKESFNINVSKIKLNKKEPFQTEQFETPTDTPKFFLAEMEGTKIYLTLNKGIVEDTYILKNDIIKLYDTDNEEDLYYFNILNVEYNLENNYKLEIENLPPNTPKDELNEKTNLNSVKVIGNKYENCVLSSSILFQEHTDTEEGDYELVFNNTDGVGAFLINPDEKEKIMNNFQEEEVIEIHHLDIKIDDRLFLIKKITDNKIILNNKNVRLVIGQGDRILIKKFDLNEIIKEYYKEKKQYNENYLVTKNKIKNIGLLVDNIKETMNV